MPWRSASMVTLPSRSRTWSQELALRIGIAFLLLAINTAIIYLDRDSYNDDAGGGISLIDALYYTTVTMTTTGYGDITPVADHARLVNAIVVTPLRIGFLVLLVGTTFEVLATEGRRALRDSRWRKRMRDHIVVIGYGTMGRSAAATLLRSDIPAERIVVIDPSAHATEMATRDGLAAFQGDGTDRELLFRAEVPTAREIIITVGHDDSAILSTLTVRQLNPDAHIVTAVRSGDNVPLLRQSGADGIVTSSESVGRIVGLSSINPSLGLLIEDLISYGEGLEVYQRPVASAEVGHGPGDIKPERVLGVVRGGTLHRFFDPAVAVLEPGDEVVAVRRSTATY